MIWKARCICLFAIIYLVNGNQVAFAQIESFKLYWAEEKISMDEAFEILKAQTPSMAFDSVSCDNCSFSPAEFLDGKFYTDHTQSPKRAPGSYWGLITITDFIVDSCICFSGYLHHNKRVFKYFNEFEVFQIKDDTILPPLLGGNRHYYTQKSLWYSNKCISLFDLPLPNLDNKLLLINLRNERGYRDTFYLGSSNPKLEFQRREHRISKDIEKIIINVAFCAIIFFSFVYLASQYLHQVKSYPDPRRSSYFYYGIFLLLTFLYYLEQLHWHTDIRSFLSVFSKYHYTIDVFFVSGLHLAYVYFFQSFLLIKNKKTLRIINSCKYVIISLPVIFILGISIVNIDIALDIYSSIRLVLFFIFGFALYLTFPRKNKLSSSERERKERKLKAYIFWGCFSLVVCNFIHFLFKIGHFDFFKPYVNYVINEFGILGHSNSYTMLGMLVENLLFIIAFAYKQKIDTEEAEKFKSEKAEAERNLILVGRKLNRSRIAEHTMSKILSVITENISQNKRLITKVNQFLRRQYEYSLEEEIQLKQEVDQIKTYVALQRLRIPDVELQINYIPSELEAIVESGEIKVPPSFLIPYIENAIDHGFNEGAFDNLVRKGKKKSASKIVKITIEEVEDELLKYTIEDTGVGISAAEEFYKGMRFKRSTGTVLSGEYLTYFNYGQQIQELSHNEDIMGTKVTVFPLKTNDDI